MKTQEQVFTLITGHCKEVLGDLDNHPFSPEDSLKELGCNSMDRAEIIGLVLESMDLDIPRVELFGAENIGQLAEIIYAKQEV